MILIVLDRGFAIDMVSEPTVSNLWVPHLLFQGSHTFASRGHGVEMLIDSPRLPNYMHPHDPGSGPVDRRRPRLMQIPQSETIDITTRTHHVTPLAVTYNGFATTCELNLICT